MFLMLCIPYSYHLGVGFNDMFGNYGVCPKMIGLDGQRQRVIVVLVGQSQSSDSNCNLPIYDGFAH